MVGFAESTVDLGYFEFHPHFDVWGVALAVVGGYAYGIRRLWARYAPRGEPAVTGWQMVSFGAGVLAFLVVAGWPFHDIGEQSLFTFHMIEHMALALVVPPLLLLGTPWWLLRLVVLPVLPALRLLTKPLVALVLFNAVLAFLHWPTAVELMLTSGGFHLFAHLALAVTATLMWWPVIGPIPDLPRLSPFGSMGYLFLQSLVPTVPASFLTFASEPVYAVYEGLPRLWGLSVLTDQLVAGLIMKLGGGVILWTAIGIVFFRWAAEEQRHAPASP
ncbi:MAG: cytochrome c oxidase assembly protein, partial [Acidimicrobiia bacterium]